MRPPSDVLQEYARRLPIAWENPEERGRGTGVAQDYPPVAKGFSINTLYGPESPVPCVPPRWFAQPLAWTPACHYMMHEDRRRAVRYFCLVVSQGDRYAALKERNNGHLLLRVLGWLPFVPVPYLSQLWCRCPRQF